MKLEEVKEATAQFIHNCLRMRRMDELTMKLEEVKEATAQFIHNCCACAGWTN
jgi:hypothetical protein